MKVYLRNFLLLSAVYSGLFVLVWICKVIFYPELPISFLNWDAGHYDFIRGKGYDEVQSAFFPFFPFLWKHLNLSAIGISILNGIVFMASFAFLSQEYNVSRKELLIYALLPSFVYCFYPYTEALFFAASTGLLYSIRHNKLLPELLFLFLLSLIRPVISVLLPALLIVHFLEKKEWKERIRNVLFATLSIAVGLAITFSIHHHYTGSWRSFFHAQELWGNHLGLPHFPLMSWAGGLITRLDGTALLISLASIIILIREAVIRKLELKSDFLLSLLYLAGCGMIVLFYRNGVLFSLNRFVICSPFLIVAWKNVQDRFAAPKIKTAALTFLVLSLYWLAFASYVHILTLLKYEAVALFLTLILFLKDENIQRKNTSTAVVSVGFLALFVFLYMELLLNHWVG